MCNKIKKISKNKRGQTGETITWLVATVIIVIILSCSILLTKLVLGSDKVVYFANDKQEEAVATQSIISFLQNPDNLRLIQNKNHAKLSENIQTFLKVLPMPPAYSAGAWNFQLYDGNNKIIDITNYNVAANFGQYNHFDNTFILGTTKLRFWLTCQGTCR